MHISRLFDITKYTAQHLRFLADESYLKQNFFFFFLEGGRELSVYSSKVDQTYRSGTYGHTHLKVSKCKGSRQFHIHSQARFIFSSSKMYTRRLLVVQIVQNSPCNQKKKYFEPNLDLSASIASTAQVLIYQEYINKQERIDFY